MERLDTPERRGLIRMRLVRYEAGHGMALTSLVRTTRYPSLHPGALSGSQPQQAAAECFSRPTNQPRTTVMAKANKDGWIRHRGGKCPVDADEKVDVRFSDGDTGNCVSAANLSWPHSHCHISCRIMAYRIHKPSEQPSPVKLPKGYGEVMPAISKSAGGPLEWRDRIREIDAEEAKRNEEHRQAIEALEEERLSLVQKLEAEGLKLIEAKPACDGMPAEDMSDWRKWKVGDLIECIGLDCEWTKEESVKIGEVKPIVDIAYGEERLDVMIGQYWLNASDFKWHSRP